MTDSGLAQIAIEEINAQSWAVTEQYLAIHELVYENDRPIIGRIDRDSQDGSIIAYLPVKDQKFHMAMVIKEQPFPEIIGIYMEPYSSVYLRASSISQDAGQLSSLTSLAPTKNWNKGDVKFGKILHKNSGLLFEPNPEPDAFEDKLDKLLDFLEQDAEGVKSLVTEAGGYIQAAMIFHNGNTMLGGVAIKSSPLKRMAALNLSLDFDLYAEGNFFT